MVIRHLQAYHQAQSCPAVFRHSTVIFLLHPSGIGLSFNVNKCFIVNQVTYANPFTVW